MGGAFITLEGIEGVGKSTNLRFVEEMVAGQGRAARVTREPGGTPLGERVREWVLEGEHTTLSAEVEALLMFAARAHHLDQVIRPALAGGQWVICDRFTDATLAYQGGGRGADMGWLESLKAAVHKGLQPDLTLLFDAPVDVGRGRISGRDQDHFEREDNAFFERVRQTYLSIAATDPRRVRIIDAAQELRDVQQQVTEILDSFFERFKPTW